MLTFKQLVSDLAQEDVSLSHELVSDLAQEDVSLSHDDVLELQKKFGERVLLMGHLQANGSMLIPVDCILEAARALGTKQLTKAAEYINNEQMIPLFKSAEEFVEHVIEARKRKLEQMVESFQSEPDDYQAHQQWKEIEKMIFGIQYKD